MSALSASLKAAEKKVVQVDETSSQGISEAERRISARVQTVVNAQTAVNEEVCTWRDSVRIKRYIYVPPRERFCCQRIGPSRFVGRISED